MDTPSPRSRRNADSEPPAADADSATRADCRPGRGEGIRRFYDLIRTLTRVQEAIADPRRPASVAPTAWSDERYCYVEIPLERFEIAEFDLCSGHERLFVRIAHKT